MIIHQKIWKAHKTQPITLVDGRVVTPPELLKIVKANILAEPLSYDQYRVVFEPPTCENPGCIAGHLQFLLPEILNDDNYSRIHEQVFGWYEWPWLFDSDFNGYGTWCEKYHTAQGSAVDLAKTACAAIDAYVEELEQETT